MVSELAGDPVTVRVPAVPSLALVGAMQTEIGTRLGRTTHLILSATPVVVLDPSQP